MNTTHHPWHLRFWRLPTLDSLELLHADNITHDYPRHMHEEYSIAIMLQGTETTICRGASHVARPGSVLLINAEDVHSSRSVDSGYRLMKVRPRLLSEIALEFTGRKVDRSYFRHLVVNDASLFRSLLKLHVKLEQNVSALEQESEFIATIGMLLTQQNRNSSRQSAGKMGRENLYVNRVRDYLKSHYAENVSLSQLASITNLSPFYLLRVFHNQVGFPPHEYQTQLRIAHARKLIRRGNSISQAALETGFFDQSHLSRNFKRIVGVTPRRYFSQRQAHPGE